MKSFTYLRKDSVFCEYKHLGIDYELFGYPAITELPSAISALIFSVYGIWMFKTWEVHQHVVVLNVATYLCFIGFGSFMYHLTFWDGFAHFDIIPMILLVGNSVTTNLYELSGMLSTNPTTYNRGMVMVGSELLTICTVIVSLYTELYEYLFVIGITVLVLMNIFSYVQFRLIISMTDTSIYSDDMTICLDGKQTIAEHMYFFRHEITKLYRIIGICILLSGFSKLMDEIVCEYDSRVSYMHFHTLWHLSIALFAVASTVLYQMMLSIKAKEYIHYEMRYWIFPVLRVKQYSL